MSILWVGGEDLDFLAAPAVSVSTSTSLFRTAYARCCVYESSMNNTAMSVPFPGGPLTSAWLSARITGQNNWGNSGYPAIRSIGLGRSGTANGLFIGTHASIGNKLALSKFNGTTTTQLATEGGTSIAPTTTYLLCVQVMNFGAAATVNVYLNGVLVITYTGDVTVSGMSDFDCVLLCRTDGGNLYTSEIVVADEDPRGFPGVATLALTGAGATDAWTGVFSTINGTSISDTTPNYTATPDLDQQFNVSDPPAGLYTVKAVRIAARAAKNGSPTKIALGYNSGGSVAVGADKALTNVYATYEQIDQVNPITGLAFTLAELTPLQVDVRSRA